MLFHSVSSLVETDDLAIIFLKGYDYSRSGNPTRECFEQCIASLDGAKYGMIFQIHLSS